MRDGERDRGLADAAGADDGDEAMQRKFGRNLLDRVVSSDHPGERGGIWEATETARACPRSPTARPGPAGRETIAAAGHVDDIAGAFAGIAQGLAQRRDVEAQAAFVDIHVGPDALDQLTLVDDLAGTLGEKNEDVERAAAEVKRDAILLEQPRPWKQPKWPEGNRQILVVSVRHAP